MSHQARRIRQRALTGPCVVCFPGRLETCFDDGRPPWIANPNAIERPLGTPDANEALILFLPRHEHVPDPNLTRCFVLSAATSPL